MDEESIETWYAEEKEKISKTYHKTINQAKNSNILAERKHFEKKMKAIIVKYNTLHHKKMKEDALRKKIKYPIKKFYAFMDGLSEMFNERD